MKNITNKINRTIIKSNLNVDFNLSNNRILYKIIGIIPTLILIENKKTIKSNLKKIGIEFDRVITLLIQKDELEMIYFLYTIEIYNMESILYLYVNEKIEDLKGFNIEKNNFFKEFSILYGNYENQIKHNININEKIQIEYEGYLDKDNNEIKETTCILKDLIELRKQERKNQRTEIFISKNKK